MAERHRPRFPPPGSSDGGGSDSNSPMKGPPSKKRRTMKKQKMEIVAPRAALDGLPDDIMLLIMTYLNILSLVRFSLVCRRFNHLGRDSSVWERVELTRESIGRMVDSQTMKRLIRLYLPQTLLEVKLEEMNLKGNLTITEALIELLFVNCPKIECITLINCDLKKFDATCKLYTSSFLKSVTFKGCELSMDWMDNIKPSWPKLENLSLERSVMINDRDLLYITHKEEWKNTLQFINLNGCYRISLEGIQKFVDVLTSLRILDIRHCQLNDIEKLTGDHLTILS